MWSKNEKGNEGRKANYAKHKINISNQFRQWDGSENKLILSHKMPDTKLGLIIGRSVQAIQVRRSKLKKRIEKYLTSKC